MQKHLLIQAKLSILALAYKSDLSLISLSQSPGKVHTDMLRLENWPAVENIKKLGWMILTGGMPMSDVTLSHICDGQIVCIWAIQCPSSLGMDIWMTACFCIAAGGKV